MILIGGIMLLTPGYDRPVGCLAPFPASANPLRKLKENLVQSVAAGKPPSDRSSAPESRTTRYRR